VQNVISELLAIEKTAQGVLVAVKQEEDCVQAEIDRSIAALERDANAQIAAIERESREETTARLAQIATDYQDKTRQMEEAFAANRDSWLAEILQNVLHGN
jgi:hypothetical protein